MGGKVGRGGKETMQWTEGKNGGAALGTAATPQSACQAKQTGFRGQEHRGQGRACGSGPRTSDTAFARVALMVSCRVAEQSAEEVALFSGRIVGEVGAPPLVLTLRLAAARAARRGAVIGRAHV